MLLVWQVLVRHSAIPTTQISYRGHQSKNVMYEKEWNNTPLVRTYQSPFWNKLFNDTFEITILWIFYIRGNIIKIWYFVNNCFINVRFCISFCTYTTHNCNYLPHTHHILFLLNRFSVTYRFPFKILHLFK